MSVAFQDGEFDGYHVASIHNHPKDILSPPSGKNFGILKRGFEDYELIAGFESFWILKAKGMHKNLINDFNEASQTTFNLALMFCIGRYNQIEMINKMHDIRYGSELSKYINNKNIDDIQLIKREYTDMASKIADYKCRKHITDPETIRLLKEFENSPYTPSAKEMMYDFYQKVGMDVEWDEIFAD